MASRFWSAASTCQTSCGCSARWRDSARARPGGAGAKPCRRSQRRRVRSEGIATPGRVRAQFDPDANGPPAGMLAAEVQDRLQEGRVRIRAATAGVIAGDQLGEGPVTGLGLRALRIRSRTVLIGRSSRRAISGGAAPSRAIRAIARRKDSSVARGIGMDSRALKMERIPRLYWRAEMHETFV